MIEMHAGDIEIAIARYLNPRQNLIVPNVSWGLGLYEKDLLVLTQSGYAWEIEIKVSLSDLIADKKKIHHHYSEKIKRLYFAVPEALQEKALLHIPDRAGLFIIGTSEEHRRNCVRYGLTNPYVRLIKSPKINQLARKFTDKEIKKLYELAAMRIWSLKEVIYKLQREKLHPCQEETGERLE